MKLAIMQYIALRNQTACECATYIYAALESSFSLSGSLANAEGTCASREAEDLDVTSLKIPLLRSSESSSTL